MNIDQVEIEIYPDEVFLPCYNHLRKSTADINFLWGGRDSGKSHFIAQHLIMLCLQSDYFRCILIKKTYESIKDSQYNTIKEIIEKWGLSEYFIFKAAPLEIVCILNGNSFIARGCDNPQKLKSIRNPSHAWYEEGNQLTEEDYITASTTLRSEHGKVQEWFSFNPECDGEYKQFWLYKSYFSHTKEVNFSHTKTVKLPSGEEVNITYTSTHTTYHDNKYCSGERQAKLEDLKNTNPYYYQIYTLGKWGVRLVEFPFWFKFRRDNKYNAEGKFLPSNIGKTKWNPFELTYLSWDFNKNPMCCQVIQMYDDPDMSAKMGVEDPLWIYGIESIKLAKSTKEVCQYIKTTYPNALYLVTGDRSGKDTGSTLLEDDTISNFIIIQDELSLEDTQIQVLNNPRLKQNRVLCNVAFEKLNILLDEERCSHAIFDFTFSEMLPDGTVKKGDRNDPAQQLDSGDGWRYFFNTFLSERLLEYMP